MDPSTLVTASRDGNVKIWRVTDGISGDDNSKVIVKEVFRFTPVCKGDKKVEAVTTSTFAPSTMTIQHDGKSWEHGVLAIGMESGLIEIWAVPLGEVNSHQPRLLLSIPLQDCHIGIVKSLAWKPVKTDESSLTLASCSTDHGVRFFRVTLPGNMDVF